MTTRSEETRATRLERAIRRKRQAAVARSPELPRRPPESPPVLGELQRGLWLVHRLQSDSSAYHLTSAFRLSGSLDVARLESGFRELVARHRILRSTFVSGIAGVRQVVHDRWQGALERFDGEPGEAREVAVREARRPFDLETGPLVRLLLIEERDDGERLLVLVLHHILADERSLRTLWRELTEICDGGAAEVADLPQYDDFVHWKGQGDERRATAFDYWRRRLDPLPEDLALPFENASGEPVASSGRLLQRSIEGDAQARIRAVAAAAGTTPFVVYAFAFRLLLQRTAGGRGFAVGTPVANRSHPATAEMVGYFLNPVVLCASIDERRSVDEALRAFAAETRADLQHVAAPFDRLVEELSPPRSHGQPFFQAMIVVQEPTAPLRLGDRNLEPITLDLGESKFDLTLFVSETPGSLEVAVEFRRERFDQTWIHRLLGHFATVVEHLDRALERPVAEVPMLQAAERGELQRASRGEPVDSADSRLLPQQILDRATLAPREPAVLGGGEEWTYEELVSAGHAIAGELRASGVQPGDRVGLFLERSPRVIAAILGTHLAGAAYVPLDPAYPPARNLEVLADAEVAAVLTTGGLRDRVPEGADGVIEIDAVASAGPGRDGGPAGLDGESPAVDAALPAYVLYTSGSTGRPKGVVVSHANLQASTGARREAYDAPPKRFLLLPSVAFDSSVAGIFWTLAEGGALIVPSDDEVRDLRQLARLVADREVTSLLCVPSLYSLLLEVGGERLRGLETVIVAGESCPPRLVERHFRELPETRLFNEYGPTEATVWATVAELHRADSAPAVTIGRPIPGVRVELRDELERLVPVGVPGEAWISGPTVTDGYWRRPELTAERFVGRPESGDGAGRAFRAGDRMAWTEDGRLRFLGRIDEQIQVRGFRVEPGEIESVLLGMPAVEEAAVVDRPGGQLVTFVTTTGPLGDWRDELADRLPEVMIPTRLVELERIPRLPNGKVDRERLRQMEIEPAAGAGSAPAILDDRERVLIALWEELLERPGIGPHDNFFRLGGHSLLAVEMTLAIERETGVRLRPAEVFQVPTVRQLARRIASTEGGHETTYEHLFPIEPGGREAPFVFCIPHFFSEPIAAAFRGERPIYGMRGVGLRPEGNRGRWRTMRELGAELAAEIVRRFGDREVVVAGYSFGATMAVEAVLQLEERDHAVRGLYLIAPMAIDVAHLGPLRFQIDDLRQPLSELSAWQALRRFVAGNHPLRRRGYQRAWRLLAVKTWRRLLCGVGAVRKRLGLPLTPRILHADLRLERFRLHAVYRPGSVRTPTTIFNAEEPETDAAETWRRCFQGPLTIVPIADPHLDEASIEAATATILKHLEDL